MSKSTTVTKGSDANPKGDLINSYSLSKCGFKSPGKPANEEGSPLKHSYSNISKAPAK